MKKESENYPRSVELPSLSWKMENEETSGSRHGFNSWPGWRTMVEAGVVKYANYICISLKRDSGETRAVRSSSLVAIMT